MQPSLTIFIYDFYIRKRGKHENQNQRGFEGYKGI